MNDQIVQALKKIKDLPSGEEIFNDKGRFKSAVADFLPGAERDMVGLRKRIVEAVELGAYVRLSKSAAVGDIATEQLRVIAILRADGIDETLAKEIVGAFAALFGSSPAIIPASTQKTIAKSESASPPPFKPPAPPSVKPAGIVTQTSPQPQSPPKPVQSVPPANVAYSNATDITAEILQGKTRNLQFGNYRWRVLDVQSDKALLITEDVIEKRPYNVKYAGVTWETCTLRKYLNGEFLQKFTGEEQGKIAETRIGNPDNLWYGTSGGSNTTDKIFLLSLEEVDRYFGNSGDYQQKRLKKYKNGRWIADSYGSVFSNVHDSDRQAKFNNGACWWWLRSPGDISNYAAYVGTVGFVGVYGIHVYGDHVRSDSGGVRPALWLNLKS